MHGVRPAAHLKGFAGAQVVCASPQTHGTRREMACGAAGCNGSRCRGRGAGSAAALAHMRPAACGVAGTAAEIVQCRNYTQGIPGCVSAARPASAPLFQVGKAGVPRHRHADCGLRCRCEHHLAAYMWVHNPCIKLPVHNGRLHTTRHKAAAERARSS